MVLFLGPHGTLRPDRKGRGSGHRRGQLTLRPSVRDPDSWGERGPSGSQTTHSDTAHDSPAVPPLSMNPRNPYPYDDPLHLPVTPPFTPRTPLSRSSVFTPNGHDPWEWKTLGPGMESGHRRASRDRTPPHWTLNDLTVSESGRGGRRSWSTGV